MKYKHVRITLSVLLFIYFAVLLRLAIFRSRTYPTEMSVNLSFFTDLVLNTLGCVAGYLIYKIYRDFRK